MENKSSKPNSWWTTLPGVLTAVAGLVTAVTGLLVAVDRLVETKSDPIAAQKPQQVQWILDNDGHGTAGMCLGQWVLDTQRLARGPICRYDSLFIPWRDLRTDLEKNILREVGRVPNAANLRLAAGPQGQLNWIMQVIDSHGKEVAHIWIGSNPLNRWEFDGLIRIGAPTEPPDVWETFRRFSDGSYKRF